MTVSTFAVGDADLARSAATGDRAAFERLANRYRPQITRAVLSRLRSCDDAEDVVQEAFARALQGITGLEQPDLVGQWLQSIALNVCRETLRQRARLVFCAAEHDPLSPAWQHAQSSWATDQGRTVLRALAQLPIEQRALLVLHCLEGAPIREVCDVFGLSPGAAKMRLLRARAAAREVAWAGLPEREQVSQAIAMAYHRLASTYFGLGRWDYLRRFWAKAVEAAPRTSEYIWNHIKIVLYKSCPPEGTDAALAVLNAGVQNHPDEPRAWLTLGKVLHWAAGETDTALSALSRAAQGHPIRGHALLTMGCLQARIGSGEKALEYLSLMEREGWVDHEIPLVRAIAFRALEQPHLAVLEARRAISLAHTNPQPYRVAHRHYVPGAVLAHFGFAREASRAFQAALAAHPPDPMTFAIERAQARLAAGRAQTGERTLWL